MALIVDVSPPDYLLCRMQQYLGLTTDRLILTAGTKAKMSFSSAGNLNDGDTLQLKWLGNDHTFTFRNAPDDSGFELPVVTSPAEFATMLTALQNNYYVNQAFVISNISAGPPYVFEAEAIDTGAGYTMDNFVEPMMTIVTPGVDDIYAENFSVFAEIYKIITGGSELVTTIDAAAASDGSVKLFFGPILLSLFDPDLPVTKISGVGFDKNHRGYVNTMIEYYVKYYERYGNPAVAAIVNEWGTEAAPKAAIDFNLDKTEIPGNTAVADHFTSVVERSLFKPVKVLRARAGYVDFVSMYVELATNNGQIDCKVNYYFTDASSSLNVPTYGAVAVNNADPHGIHEFSIVVDQAIAYADSQAKIIDYFEVYIQSTATGALIASELIRYEMDTSVAENLHIFLFRNKSGAWSTWYFTGHLRNQREYERVEAQIVANPDFDPSVSEIYTYNHRMQCVFQVATGLLTPEEIANLDEFANAEEVYILDGAFGDDNAFWRSVILEPGAFSELHSSEGEMESRLFSFKNAFYSGC